MSLEAILAALPSRGRVECTLERITAPIPSQERELERARRAMTESGRRGEELRQGMVEEERWLGVLSGGSRWIMERVYEWSEEGFHLRESGRLGGLPLPAVQEYAKDFYLYRGDSYTLTPGQAFAFAYIEPGNAIQEGSFTEGILFRNVSLRSQLDLSTAVVQPVGEQVVLAARFARPEPGSRWYFQPPFRVEIRCDPAKGFLPVDIQVYRGSGSRLVEWDRIEAFHEVGGAYFPARVVVQRFYGLPGMVSMEDRIEVREARLGPEAPVEVVPKAAVRMHVNDGRGLQRRTYGLEAGKGFPPGPPLWKRLLIRTWRRATRPRPRDKGV
jgi:hypothetical protein